MEGMTDKTRDFCYQFPSMKKKEILQKSKTTHKFKDRSYNTVWNVNTRQNMNSSLEPL